MRGIVLIQSLSAGGCLKGSRRLFACSGVGLVVAACLNLAPSPSRGSESPQPIKSLTPEEARELVRQRPGKPLDLLDVRELSPETARALAATNGDLFLSGLPTLSAEVARALSVCRGNLYLNGLSGLSAEAAGALTSYEGDLFLNELETISAPAADLLARRTGRTFLLGLRELSCAALADGAVAGRIRIDFGGLRKISADAFSPELARTLASQAEMLTLDGLSSLTAEVAQALSQHRGNLYLDGVKTLPDDAAAALSRHEGDLGLSGLAELSEIAAAELAKHRGKVFLHGLRRLSSKPLGLAATAGRVGLNCERLKDITTEVYTDEIFRQLMAHDNTLRSQLPSALSVEAAKALAERKDRLTVFLPHVSTLSEDAAKELGESTHSLALNGLKSLSPEIALQLARHTETLHLDGLEVLSPDAAGSLSQYQGRYLSLDGLEALSDDAAEALSRCKCDLSLTGVATLSVTAATSLSRGGRVRLWHLKTLPDDAVAILKTSTNIEYNKNSSIFRDRDTRP